MNCEQARKLLTLDPRLVESGDEVRRHVNDCRACSAYQRRMLALDEVLSEWHVPSAPEHIPARVSVRLAAETRTKQTIRALLERALVPIVVATGLLLGTLLGQHLTNTLEATRGELANQNETNLIVDPLSGSFTEAVETMALASAGR